MFDSSTSFGHMDLVVADGGHSYELAADDMRAAPQRCRPGGVVLWHDFADYGDFTRAVLDNVPHCVVVELENTDLAAYRAPG
jgi:hypothetical protein